MCGAYDIPATYLEIQGVFTNTTPLSAYRGVGRAEMTYMLERLLDQAARQIGYDPIVLR